MNVNVSRALTGLTAAAIGASLALSPSPASAQEEVCEVAAPMSPTRLLRRLSLDLRGRAPTMTELVDVRDGVRVPQDFIDDWLNSRSFVGVMRRHHEELLWPNLEQVELVPQTHMIYPYQRESGNVVYVSPIRSVYVRASGAGYLFEPCEDAPAEFDEDGQLVLKPVVVGSSTVAWVDGWIEVQPYWDPSSTIKVCALEALEAFTAPACPQVEGRYPFIEPQCQSVSATAQAFNLPFRGAKVDCEGPLSTYAPGCACGSDLRRCHTPETLAALRNSLNEQALRMGDRTLEEGRPYHEMLTDPRVEVSGPIAHYLRYQSRLSFDLFADPDATAPMEDAPLAFRDEGWVSIERTGRHSGMLTTPAYLMRHAAWRQRAHRFYNAFECSSFTPSGPLPSPSEPCSQREDLTERCGCDGCHQTLEPMAAHWGRFTEFGFMHLDPESFPANGIQACSPPYSSLEQIFNCSRLYELQPVGEERDYYGFLHAYVFRDLNESRSIDQGPRALVEASIESGRFAACAAERMWERFMHRSPTSAERTEVLPTLTQAFVDGGYDLKALVRAITTQSAYGRAP